MRIGFGYDVHRLVEGRPLILGGVKIEYPFGLAGHSDADVLCHAIADALLGAAGIGDIGKTFPDTDAKYLGISSELLLTEVAEMLLAQSVTIQNIDATIAAESPRLSPHIDSMVANVARSLQIGINRVSVKATSTEGIGFIGRGEGIAAYAVSLVEEHA